MSTSERIAQYFQTHDTEDGFSIDVDGNVPTSGYMVALVGYEEIIPPSFDLRRAIASYFERHSAHVTGNLYFGGWRSDSGQYYLDISENIRDYRHAVIAGRRRQQLAIWDVVNQRSIDIV